MINFLKMRWLFNKGTVKTLLCMVLLLLVAGVVNLAGIQIAGGIQVWTVWLKAHAGIFLVWRILLYVGVICGWLWMRKRILKRESSKEAKVRFIRIEITAVVALLVLETSNLVA